MEVLFFVTCRISPSTCGLLTLHALSPPLVARSALDLSKTKLYLDQKITWQLYRQPPQVSIATLVATNMTVDMMRHHWNVAHERGLISVCAMLSLSD